PADWSDRRYSCFLSARVKGLEPWSLSHESAPSPLPSPEPGRTSNAEHRMAARILDHFGVRCSMLNVRCFPSLQEFDARIVLFSPVLQKPLVELRVVVRLRPGIVLRFGIDGQFHILAAKFFQSFHHALRFFHFYHRVLGAVERPNA